MKKQISIFLILLFIIGLIPVNISKAITQNQIDAEVQIVCTDGTNWFSGSGTIIDSKGIILTNRHVVEGAYKDTCFIGFIEEINQEPDFGTAGNYNLAEVKYKTTTDDMDAAILYLDNPTNKPYPYVNIWDSNSSSLKFGDKVEVIGFPSIGGSTITYTSGDFSGFGSSSDGTQNYIKTTAPLEHGNSGGGAYNSSGGFIGIPTMVVTGTLNSMSYILSVNSIKGWLNGVLGSQYQQEVTEQKPTVEEPTTSIQNDITPPNFNILDQLCYHIYDSTHKDIGGRCFPKKMGKVEEFNHIQFELFKSYLPSIDLGGLKKIYYYFDNKIHTSIDNGVKQYVPTDINNSEILITDIIDISKEGKYYFTFFGEDNSGNISNPFVYEYIYEKNYHKQLKTISFFKDENLFDSLGKYEFKTIDDSEKPINKFDDELVCKTRLKDLYFKWEYPREIKADYLIYSQQGDYFPTKDGKLINKNSYNIKNLNSGRKVDSYIKIYYDWGGQSAEAISSKIIYNIYLKPLTISDVKNIDPKHILFKIIYDANISKDLVCISTYDAKNKFPLRSYGDKLNYDDTNNVYSSLIPDYTDTRLANKLKGQILLQVESNGEAYYIYPDDSKKYYLGRPADAFNAMRKLGLGATHEFITSRTIYPNHVLGKILLDVEDQGKAYYIYPKDKKAYYLGKPADAFKVMRELGLGITNNDLNKIQEGNL